MLRLSLRTADVAYDHKGAVLSADPEPVIVQGEDRSESPDFPGSEISTSIGRLLSARSEGSLQAVNALRQGFDASLQSLEAVISAQSRSDEDVSKSVEHLAAVVAEYVRTVSERVQAEAETRVKAAVAKTHHQRLEAAALSERLNQTQSELEVFRSRLEAQREQSMLMVAEMSHVRKASAQAEAAREKAEAAHCDEVSARVAIESELQRVRVAVDTTRNELGHLRHQLHSAISDVLGPADEHGGAQDRAERAPAGDERYGWRVRAVSP